MKMKDVFNYVCDNCINEIDEAYSIERLNKELKMESRFDKKLIDEIVKSNSNGLVRYVSGENGIALYKICNKQKDNCQNTMLAVKYEDNDMYARTFIEYLMCCETTKQIEHCLGDELSKGFDL